MESIRRMASQLPFFRASDQSIWNIFFRPHSRGVQIIRGDTYAETIIHVDK